MESRLDLKLDTLIFKLDPEPHIVVQVELCLTCEGRPCTFVCPANLFVWEDSQMVFNCDGCLECGSRRGRDSARPSGGGRPENRRRPAHPPRTRERRAISYGSRR